MFNDEAHHCYQDKPLEDPSASSEAPDAEERARNADARVWFKGLQAMAAKVGIKQVFDLSATPFYLHGSGYNEGFIFPWTVSDFSLMDAIESGIVKVPRVPVDDDSAEDIPTYLRLWDHVGKELPKKLSLERLKALQRDGWVPPKVLEGALESLHTSYAARFAEWENELQALGEPPPVMIVVCPNTTVSKLVFDWIAGTEVERPDGEPVLKPGKLPLLSNAVDGEWLARPRTILVDSAALESGESFKDDFKKAAAHEVEAFKAEFRRRNPGADVDKITDEDLLREVMNTVGKRGMLGEQVRCVVSVSMLTEGWDANTVTHILGVRAFRSQLLCEQVVGRGLRRRSYAPNADDRFEPEYADVYGVPFAFIPSDRPAPTPKPAAGDRGAVGARPRPPGDPLPASRRLPLGAPRRLAVRGLRSRGERAHHPRRAGHLGADVGHRRRPRQRGTRRVPPCPAAEGGLRDRRGAGAQALHRVRRGGSAVAVSPTGGAGQAVARRVRDVRRRRLRGPAAPGPDLARGRAALQRHRRAARESRGDPAPDVPPFRPRGLDSRRAVPHSQGGDRGHQEPGEPRGARRPEGEHLGGGGRRDSRGPWRGGGVREERLARLQNPLRPPGAQPRIRARLPRPPHPRARRHRANADHRGVGQPRSRPAPPRRRPTPPEASGVER
ncbi:MAG: hypothetical protein V9E99_19045 [Microthrixaceae bacterium]